MCMLLFFFRLFVFGFAWVTVLCWFVLCVFDIAGWYFLFCYFCDVLCSEVIFFCYLSLGFYFFFLSLFSFALMLLG